MATLQDVQTAIDNVTAAELVEAQAIEALGVADAAVATAVATETATFVAAQTVYTAALTTARDNAGWTPLLEARDAAILARESAENAARAVMLEFVTP